MPAEMYRWEATDRSTGTVYREDERGLGSFSQLDAARLSQLALYTQVPGGEAGVHLAVPLGAEAVFTRRRVFTLEESARQFVFQPGYTIIGYRWPDGSGVYHFFDAEGNTFESTDFNAV